MKLQAKTEFQTAENAIIGCLWLTDVFKIQCQNVLEVSSETQFKLITSKMFWDADTNVFQMTVKHFKTKAVYVRH